MKLRKFYLLVLILPLLAFSDLHKYYISVTQVNFNKDYNSIQMTSKIFVDDFQQVLREHYDENIILDNKNKSRTIDLYIERYLLQKIKVTLNNKAAKIVFIGKEYDADIIKCYLEIEGVNRINTLEISNKVLFEIFEDQQNIIKTKINSKRESFILLPKKDAAVLKFN
jgi:hypothetical protein